MGEKHPSYDPCAGMSVASATLYFRSTTRREAAQRAAATRRHREKEAMRLRVSEIFRAGGGEAEVAAQIQKSLLAEALDALRWRRESAALVAAAKARGVS